MKKKITKIIPDYMEKFSCIGDKCEDSCCYNWTVSIDHKTYKKYQKVTDSTMKKRLKESVKRIKKDANDIQYAKIELNEAGGCPLLDGNLCSVHKNLGESHLSNTCAVYPKTLNRVNGAIEQSAVVSCPEITRLAILNPNGISFKQIEEDTDARPVVNRVFRTDDETLQNTPLQYFWELRLFTIQVLQNRNYSIDERMMILALFYNRLQEYQKENRVQEIPVLIGQYLNEMDSANMRENFATIKPLYHVQITLIEQMMLLRLQKKLNKRYTECMQDTIEGLNFADEMTIDEKATRYQEAIEKDYLPFIAEKEYVLENYLVNYVFREAFPYLPRDLNIYDEFVVMLTRYAMIKLHLIGMSAKYKEDFTDELIVKCIQSFSRSVEHDVYFSYKLYDLLKEKELHTVGYVCALLKN